MSGRFTSRSTAKVYVAGTGKDADKGLLVDVGAIPGAERWTLDRSEAMRISPGQAKAVIAVLRRAGIQTVTCS